MPNAIASLQQPFAQSIEPQNVSLPKEMEQFFTNYEQDLDALGASLEPENLIKEDVVREVLNECLIHCEEEPVEQRDFAQSCVIRRLLKILNRIAEVVERHLEYKQEENFLKESEILEKIVPGLQSATKKQAGAYAAQAFGIALFTFVGFKEPNLEKFSAVCSPGALFADRLLESSMKSGEMKKNLYLQTVSSTRQSEEGLKNLIYQNQQLLTKVNDLLLQMYRGTALQG